MPFDSSQAIFSSRLEAARSLAARLYEHAGRRDLLVLGLPRGGVPVAAEVARRLGAELEVWVVRELGVPGSPELAMGAIASGGVLELDRKTARALRIPERAIREAVRRETAELERREAAYRSGRPAPRVTGRPVILVDDGIATGSTMHAAISALRKLEPALVIVAAPVASSGALEKLWQHADAVMALASPDPFTSVGRWYASLEPISDEQVVECLDRDARRRRLSAEAGVA